MANHHRDPPVTQQMVVHLFELVDSFSDDVRKVQRWQKWRSPPQYESDKYMAAAGEEEEQQQQLKQ